MSYYFPCFAMVMFKQSLDILKYKYFGPTFFHDTCKFSKKCTSSIFKSTLLTYNREGLAWCPSNKNVYFVSERFCIEFVNIRMPLIFFYRIVCKICFLAIGINIPCKLNIIIQIETLESILNRPNSAKRCTQSYFTRWI